MEVAESWSVIHDWLYRNAPGMRGLLRGPADPVELQELERRVGHGLPDDLKASYQIHDGSDPMAGILVGLPLMSVTEMSDAWQLWAGVAEDLDDDMNGECQSRPPDAVKLVYANRGWVPFVGDSQNHIALDFDPGPNGHAGQVINCGRDDMVRHVVGASVTHFLAMVAAQFATGRVRVNPDQHGEPRWLSLADGSGDLLTGFILQGHAGT